MRQYFGTVLLSSKNVISFSGNWSSSQIIRWKLPDGGTGLKVKGSENVFNID